MLTKRFNKFLKKRGQEKNQQAKRYSGKIDYGFTNFTCFSCGKQGHIKVKCPNLVNKETDQEKKKHQEWKGKTTLHCLGRQWRIFQLFFKGG